MYEEMNESMNTMTAAARLPFILFFLVTVMVWLPAERLAHVDG